MCSAFYKLIMNYKASHVILLSEQHHLCSLNLELQIWIIRLSRSMNTEWGIHFTTRARWQKLLCLFIVRWPRWLFFFFTWRSPDLPDSLWNVVHSCSFTMGKSSSTAFSHFEKGGTWIELGQGWMDISLCHIQDLFCSIYVGLQPDWFCHILNRLIQGVVFCDVVVWDSTLGINKPRFKVNLKGHCNPLPHRVEVDVSPAVL